jgi:hypothetical protein
MSSKDLPKAPSAPNESRRQLLRTTLYVAPAVIATLVTTDAEAGACAPTRPACSCAPSGVGTSRCP